MPSKQVISAKHRQYLTDGLTKEKQDLQTEIKAAEESLSSAGEELKDLKKQLTQLEEEVEKARKQRDEVQIRWVVECTAFFP